MSHIVYPINKLVFSLAFALGVILFVNQAQAHCTSDPAHNASHQKDPCNKGGGGNDQMVASFVDDDENFPGIQSDGAGLYVNGEPGVDVSVGGAGRRIRIDLNSDGSQGSRFFRVNADCLDGPCSAGDPLLGDFPLSDSNEYAVLDVFHVADMPADGRFYPKNATFQIAGLASGKVLQFRFREPELFNPGGACSNDGSDGAGISVWVARSEDGSEWLVTTQTPPPGDLGAGLNGDEAGDIACLEISNTAIGTIFGGNYSIPFSVEVGPESVIAP